MRRKIDRLTIKGFKSIMELNNFPLGDINVVVGANGAGKSNFVQMFRMVRAMVRKDFQNFIATHDTVTGVAQATSYRPNCRVAASSSASDAAIPAFPENVKASPAVAFVLPPITHPSLTSTVL